MILEFIEALDLGDLGQQRLLLKAVERGNLSGIHLFHGSIHLYAFPFFEVKTDELVVVYLQEGKQSSRKFEDAICHFFYSGFVLHIWEETGSNFRLVLRT